MSQSLRPVPSGLKQRLFNATTPIVFIGVCCMAIGGQPAVDLVLLACLPTLLFLFREVQGARLHHLAALVCVLQFIGYLLIAHVVYPRMESVPDFEIARYRDTWIGLLVITPLLWLRVQAIPDFAVKFRLYVPIGLLISFFVLTYFYVWGAEPGVCRVKAWSFNPLFPPLWIAILTLGCLADWASAERWQRTVCLGLLFMSVVVAAAYTGARMVLIIQVLLAPAFVFLALHRVRLGKRIRDTLMVVLVLVVALLAAVAIDGHKGCKFSTRAQALVSWLMPDAPLAPVVPSPREAPTAPKQIETVEPAPKPVQRSIGLRLSVWTYAIDAIKERPLLGYGLLNEKAVLEERRDHWIAMNHAHQVYLSLMLWGGIPALLSFLILLISPLFLFRGLKSRRGFLLTVAFIAPLGLNGLTDTIMLLRPSFPPLIAVFLVLYFYARDEKGAELLETSRYHAD